MSSIKPSQQTRTGQAISWSRVLGVLLAVVGGLAVVASALYVSGNTGYLWSLLLVAIMLGSIGRSKKVEALVIGLVMFLSCLVVVSVILYLRQTDAVWALILIAILSESVAEQLTG